MKLYIYLIIFGLLAAAGNLLGGFLITGPRAASRLTVKRLVAVGAGFMLAAVILETIPQIIKLWSGSLWSESVEMAMAWVLGGYLLIQFAEHALSPHLHFGEEVHMEEVGRRGFATTAVVALGIHAFFDGVAIASGILTSLRLGIFLSLAVLIHKLPEGFTVASIVLSSGHGARAARRATIFVAIATFAGIVLVVLARPLVTYTLPLSAGVTLYVAASDLIPEVNHEGGGRMSLLVLAGIMLFYLVHLLLHSALGA